ncbi:tetratricopeptide repeat protein, partial [Rubrivirga sp.]|uniref:tetratricopeptide repeat protein n=1 Tax=Rubrivirga sp. TaxID=1885344 RepID=UPI003C757E00
ADAVRTVADALERDLSGLPAGSARPHVRSALVAVQSGDLDAALVSLIEAVQIDRAYEEDIARKLAVALFLMLGEADPVVRTHRPVFNRSLF